MARQFTVNTEYVRTAANAAFQFNTDICYMAVIYIDTLSATNGLCSCISTYGSAIYINSSNDMVFNKTGVVNVTAPAATRMSTGKWWALSAYATNGGDCKFKSWDYVNQVLATGTTTDTGAIISPSAAPLLEWGRLNSFSYAFLGRIDRVMFAQIDPTDAEFMQFAMGGFPLRSVKNLCWMVGNSPETDWSGLVETMSVNGTTRVDGAPTGAWLQGQNSWRGAFTAAGGGGGSSMPVMMHNYRRRRAA